ncbi:ankyrin repeat domain-containing protein [Sphingobacterium sp. LRF_L2]|uniref:ankyrin repeat domain-containing protein n=1 Tax=Sphingobacterium sp. LRF_L2 TaxID=3369421 RepID=UPI003F627778
MSEKTPFIQAVNRREFEEAVSLLQSGQGIPASMHSQNLPFFFHQIMRDKGYSLIRALVEHGDIPNDIYEFENFRESIYYPIFKSINPDTDLLDLLQFLLTHAENLQDEVDEYTLLSYAFEVEAPLPIVKALIDAGLRTDIRNNAEETLLHTVIKYCRAPAEKLVDYVKLLLAEGLDIQDRNIVKKTALHMAIESNKKQLLDLLLEQGSSPNDQDAEGNSAFFYAIVHKLDLDIYNKLSAFESIDFDQRNKEGKSVLHEHLRMLHGSYETNPLLLTKLLEDGADLNATSLHYHVPKSGWDWVAEKNPIVLDLALRLTMPDINQTDDQGNTLLHKVCAVNCNYDQQVAKDIYKKVKMLLEAGADSQLTNNKEQTALMLASADNLKTKTVELLILHSQKEK